MSPLARALLRLLRVYQGFSSLRRPSCRFEPSCSAYAAEAVATHGGVRGSGLAVRRLLRCQPLSAGGWDPVPDARRAARPVPSTPSVAGADSPRHAVPGV